MLKAEDLGIKWTERELAKIAEIKARSPEARNQDQCGKRRPCVKSFQAILDSVQGMSDFQVNEFIKRRKI